MRNDQLELMELNRQTRLFEILIRRLYGVRCQPGDVCVDAGANKGKHTFPMATAVAPNGVVHAFEPIPKLAKRLRKIADERHLPVRVHQIALSDTIGRAQFHFVKNITGLSSLFNRQHKKDVDIEEIEVEVSTLDTILMSSINACRFYKLDLEAGELKALKGSRSIIEKYQPLIVFENGFHMAAKVAGHSKEDWFAFFASIHYQTFDLYGYKITPDRWPDPGQPFNTIAVSREGRDQAFVETAWRGEVDLVISAVRSGSLIYGPG